MDKTEQLLELLLKRQIITAERVKEIKETLIKNKEDLGVFLVKEKIVELSQFLYKYETDKIQRTIDAVLVDNPWDEEERREKIIENINHLQRKVNINLKVNDLYSKIYYL